MLVRGRRGRDYTTAMIGVKQKRQQNLSNHGQRRSNEGRNILSRFQCVGLFFPFAGELAQNRIDLIFDPSQTPIDLLVIGHDVTFEDEVTVVYRAASNCHN